MKIPVIGDGSSQFIRGHERKLGLHPGDCGIDLYPMVRAQDDLIWSSLGFYRIVSVPTRVQLLVPAGHFAWITGRSSSVDKLMGCQVIPGIIDHGYTGEYRIRVAVPEVSMGMSKGTMLENLILQHSRDGIALAQAIILPFMRAELEWVTDFKWDQLTKNLGRGAAGYGSTDKVPAEKQDEDETIAIP